jgi:hypothetical protein
MLSCKGIYCYLKINKHFKIPGLISVLAITVKYNLHKTKAM